jgi:hypothetical protein
MLAKAEKFIKKANGVKEEETSEMEIKEEIDEGTDTKFDETNDDDQMDIKEEEFDDVSDEDIPGDEDDFDLKEDQSGKSKPKPERKPDTAVAEGRVLFLR